MKASDLPLTIKIASPCPARWEDMGGDDRVRSCDPCRKNVYNLSALTTGEARDLLAEKDGNLCARIFQRDDGTVLTEDCPVGIMAHWRKARAALAGCLAAVVFALTGIVVSGKDVTGTPVPGGDKTNGPVKVRPELNFRLALMGDVAPMTPKTNLLIMGKVVAPPKKLVPAPQSPKK